MRTERKFYAIVFTLGLLASEITLACSIPRKGATYRTHDALIDNTEKIVLAKFACDEESCHFKTVNALRGNMSQSFMPISWERTALKAIREKRIEPPNDFTLHSDTAFWEMQATRSAWHGGSCTPSFTFIPGEKYLLFVDSPANHYSAELIKSSSDHWLEYVANRIKQ